MLISILFKDPILFLMITVPLLYSIIFHEVAHGYVAYIFGDDTAKRYGRFSLNPLLHLDPIGTISLLIIGFGWAKPVPVNYYRLKDFRLGLICVSVAGCLTNIFIALIAIFLLKFIGVNANQYLATTLLFVAMINLVLGIFNLVPIPPLDGSKILMGFLPREAQISFAKIEPYGMFIIFFLFIMGFFRAIFSFVQRLIFTLIQ